MHKRKHRRSTRDDVWGQSAHQTNVQSTPNVESIEPDPCLYIQAHEADVIRGPPASVARSLEYPLAPSLVPESSSRSGLIQWEAERSYGMDTVDPQESKKNHLWVDRYDVRLLLDHLPDHPSETMQSRPSSPSGWSDLPSDSEDTFFFSPDELEDYHREKRRRLIDRGREERLRALAGIDGPKEDPDPWGGSGEEPNEAERELMRRTATHITSSPNPGQLEMRILANYGTDKRFAFLRGRWSQVWKAEKEKATQRQVEEVNKVHSRTTPTSLGGLASYGDSDTDGGELEDESTGEPEDATHTTCKQDSHNNEDEKKKARKIRAREWSIRRRGEKSFQLEDARATCSATQRDSSTFTSTPHP